MQLFPNVVQPFVDKFNRIMQPWMGYLQQFTIPPPPFQSVTVSTSPFSYYADEPGNLFITGGTVSLITLTRGTDTLTIATSTSTPRIIPLAIHDIVEITYTVLPTITFIPSYGQNTTS